jgi:hypothetical protein
MVSILSLCKEAYISQQYALNSIREFIIYLLWVALCLEFPTEGPIIDKDVKEMTIKKILLIIWI